MAGNVFSTGGDVAAGVYSQSGFSNTYTTEQYALGTIRVQQADEVESGLSQSTPAGTTLTGDENEKGNSGVDRDINFALLGGDREWLFVYAKEAVEAGELCEWDFDHGIAFAVEPSDADAMVTPLLAGVADNDIAAGSYGWIIKSGTCVVKAASDVAKGDVLASNTTEGQVDDDGVAGCTVGVALEDHSTTKASFVQALIAL
jgi:predicted RecA/RadA family phage recombinase